MQHIRKYLACFLILLIVVGVAVLAGKYFAEKKRPLTKEQLLAKETEKTRQKADYFAASPHFGPLVQTQKITVEFDNDSTYGYLGQEQAKQVKNNQQVILYDKKGAVLPLGGHISTIDMIDDSNISKITISLPEETNTEFLSNDLDIIVFETISSKRLPFSALQTDKSGKDYVWVIEPQDNKSYTVRQQYIEQNFSDAIYFDPGRKVRYNDLVILNPNEKIRSGKNYNIFVTKLDAPLHNPIKQAWGEFELDRLKKQQIHLKKIAEDCLKGVRSPNTGDVTFSDGSRGPTGKNSCVSTGAETSPFTIFESLIQQ